MKKRKKKQPTAPLNSNGEGTIRVEEGNASRATERESFIFKRKKPAHLKKDEKIHVSKKEVRHHWGLQTRGPNAMGRPLLTKAQKELHVEALFRTKEKSRIRLRRDPLPEKPRPTLQQGGTNSWSATAHREKT